MEAQWGFVLNHAQPHEKNKNIVEFLINFLDKKSVLKNGSINPIGSSLILSNQFSSL